MTAENGDSGKMDEAAKTQEARLTELKKRLEFTRNMRRAYTGLSIASFFLSLLFGLPPLVGLPGLLLISPDLGLQLGLMLAVGGVVILVSAAAFPVGMREYQVQEVEDAIDLQNIGSASHEQKAYKLLRIQQGQLTRFLTVILGQSKIIFGVGLLAMLIGVAVIMFAIHEARGAGDTEKWIVGVLGAIGAILTNYVASVYIKMFGDIGGAVKDSVAMLARSSNANFANVLVSKMDQDKMVRDAAYKELAIAIVSKN